MKKIAAANAKTKTAEPTPIPAAAADEGPLDSDWTLEVAADVAPVEVAVVVSLVATVDPFVVMPEVVDDVTVEVVGDEVSDEVVEEASDEVSETVEVEELVVVALVALGSTISESNRSLDEVTNSPSIAIGLDLQAL
jgi:hypothetical protein